VWSLTDLDAPPIAKISWTSWDRPTNEGIPLWFDGRNMGTCGCVLPYGAVLDYNWDFGDGSSGRGSTIYHTFGDNGQYTVTLTVSDGAGASSTTSTIVTVENVAPTGTFSVSPAAPTERGSYVLTIDGVTDVPADLPSVQAALDCGDGRGFQSVGVGHSLTCAAPNDGQRTVRAQLRDKDGGVTEYSKPLWIQNVAPAVTIVGSPPATIPEQIIYTISFKFADPGLLDHWSYTVNWGDGTSTTPINVSTQGGTISASHRYSVVRRGGSKSTSYVVTVSVSDDAGATGSVASTVVVTAK
jgi:PKD repeat protein